MKTRRQAKILELIQQNNVETQEELSAYLEREGYQVTQATVSRDIRELKLTKIATDNGRQKYAVIADADTGMLEKYARVLREGYVSMDIAQNILVIKTVSGMLGHFSAGFTLDTYAHVTTAAQKEAANTMGNVLAGTAQNG
mgnify:CR=1 FL=1